MAHASILDIEQKDYEYLQSLCRCRTIQAQIVDRAKILIYKAQGESNVAIAERIDVNVNTVKLCLKKFKEGGVDLALYDKPRPGHPVEITDDAVAWIVDLACQRPADLGYSQELWTLKNLHQHIQKNAQEAGFPRLATITKPMVQKILRRSEIKPFKIKYYCEKRDPEFEQKMHDVLLVYKQISLQINEDGSVIIPEDGVVVLLTGEAIPLVSESHKSSDFINLLKKLDSKYPEGDVIRIICDNHSAHKSKETKNYLATCPEGRFVFVFTPTHGSWLNMIESFFSKMTKQMLKGIRVKSKEELAERIYLYFEEVNREPVVYHWTYKMDEISQDEAVKAGVKSNAN